MRFKKAVVIVFDSFGIGELPDAAVYNDLGSDTIDNMAKAAGGLKIPNLVSMGIGLIEGVDNVEKTKSPIGSYGRMSEASKGKDTATGHWEMCGIILEVPFPTFPDGFPKNMMDEFTRKTGYGYLGGKPASGTGIIDDLGEEHLRSGKLIVYTSADSVFQIAAHEDIVPVEELYRVCRIAREFLYEHNVERVIARPFMGSPGSFKRTERRKDWPISPPGTTLLERIKEKGLPVVGIGKIGDIFAHRGLTEEIHTKSDTDGIEKTIDAIKKTETGFIFTNLVDFDTLYGHRNDYRGYADALSRIDAMLPRVMELIGEDTLLFITADHGCDPTTPSTDHSREYVPILVYGKGVRKGVNLGTRKTFADLGATIAEALGVEGHDIGQSFMKELL